MQKRIITNIEFAFIAQGGKKGLEREITKRGSVDVGEAKVQNAGIS